jgi:hypothetical protein
MSDYGGMNETVQTPPPGRARRYARGFVTIVLLTGLVLGGLMYVILPSKKNSVAEGRPLAQFPALTWNDLIYGRFATGVQNFTSDQVAGRNRWVTLHAVTQASVFKNRIVNGIYMAPHNMLLEQTPALKSSATLAADLTVLRNAAAKGHAPLVFVYIPRKEEVFADQMPPVWKTNTYLPAGAKVRAQAATVAPVLNLSPLFTKTNRWAQYYDTDHHWNAVGAFNGYRAVVSGVDKLGKTAAWKKVAGKTVSLGVPLTSADLKSSGKHPNFYGSLGRTITARVAGPGDPFVVGLPKVWPVSACILTSCGKPVFVEKYANLPGIYSNRYQAWLGGDQPEITITNPKARTNLRILVLHDSYGSPLVAYLSASARYVTAVDERSFKGSLPKLAASGKYDLVIVAHNIRTLLGDAGFSSATWTGAPPPSKGARE